jgi:hemoglobin
MLRVLMCIALFASAPVFAADSAKTTPKMDKMDKMGKMDGKMDKMAATGKKSLFDRLGGHDAITAVVEKFVAKAAADPKVNFLRAGKVPADRFAGLNIEQLKKHLVDFISKATGGPDAYTGRDMKSSHQGMKITDAEFTALAGDLATTLDEFKVPAAEKNELMKIAASTKKDIVETK